MKKTSLFFALFSFAFFFGQIKFEKGYYISNDNQRVDVLVKNMDWKNNPTYFEYRKTEDAAIQKLTIDDVQVFEVLGESKYVRNNVMIDRSNPNLSQISEERDPKFNQELLFLKELVPGDAALYEYTAGNLIRYFIKKGDKPTEQLVYKSYMKDLSSLTYNEDYKIQLKNELNCDAITSKDTNDVRYEKNSLEKLFVKYNTCKSSDYVSKIKQTAKGKLNLNLRPRLTSSKATIGTVSKIYRSNFDNELDFGMGVELEYVLPFNKNKWAVIVEPTYRSYSSEINDIESVGLRRNYSSTIKYQSIQFPIGLRHYFYINANSKLFINASVVIDAPFSSTFEQKIENVPPFNELKLTAKPNAAFGAGYNFRGKYAVEVRYFTETNITTDYVFISSPYNAVSFILSYNLF